MWVSMVKAMVPEQVCQIIDQAIQIHGATGVSQWTPLAEMYANQRTCASPTARRGASHGRRPRRDHPALILCWGRATPVARLVFPADRGPSGPLMIKRIQMRDDADLRGPRSDEHERRHREWRAPSARL